MSTEVEPIYTDDRVTLFHGDCREVMAALPDCSIDAIVTDPPYELGFMGKRWDASGIAYDPMVWGECLRVLKPGGHLLAFGGTRTWHRLAVAIEDAGFEVRDSIAWMYGSGFPKSLDVSKAIDKKRDDRADVLRVTSEIARLRDIAGLSNRDLDDAFGFAGMAGHWTSTKSQPAVPRVEQWAVLRDMLNPDEWLDDEVWRLNGRKGTLGEAWDQREVLHTDIRQRNSTAWETKSGMLAAGIQDFSITAPATPAAQQWQGWGTALKPAHEPIVVARKWLDGTVAENVLLWSTGALNIDGSRISLENEKAPTGSGNDLGYNGQGSGTGGNVTPPAGRWPANVILDESQAAELDRQSGDRPAGAFPKKSNIPTGRHYEGGWGAVDNEERRNLDTGGASRFFYVPKANKRERPNVNGVAHPTVKPLQLMRYLINLVTPPDGIVMDPFSGSGATIEAAILDNKRSIGIELTDEYLPLIQERIARQTDGKLL